MAIAPPRLRPGDTVAVCAPSGPIRREAVATGLDALGARYRVKVDDGIYAREGLFAGDDARRAGELDRYFRDPDVRAIFCARGGHGLLRILPHLDAAALAADPKLIVGFSDITLLLAWAHHAGVRGVHGPVVTQLGRLPPADQEALFKLLETTAPPPPMRGSRLAASALGIARGPLLGGNLELTSRLLGTPWAQPLGGAIWFAEDIDERPYRIDRILAHHLAAGGGSPAGLALGDFTRCDPAPEAPPVTASDVFAGYLGAHPMPALGGLPFGHGERNVALPYGARTVIAPGELIFEEAAVA